MRQFLRRRSTVAFLMALPMLAVLSLLVLVPALYSISLAMLN